MYVMVDGAEGASTVRRAPFPLSRIPASIEHSMKLLRVCVFTLEQSIRFPSSENLDQIRECKYESYVDVSNKHSKNSVPIGYIASPSLVHAK